MLDRLDLEPVFFAPFVSSVMTVEPAWIDYNGHLNMAYYNVLFDRHHRGDERGEEYGFQIEPVEHPPMLRRRCGRRPRCRPLAADGLWGHLEPGHEMPDE